MMNIAVLSTKENADQIAIVLRSHDILCLYEKFLPELKILTASLMLNLFLFYPEKN